VEIDRVFAAALQSESLPNLKIVEADFLAMPPDGVREAIGALGGTELRAAGNLPYNAASPILFRLVDLYAAGLPLADATVMLQREVADRLLAVPGTKDYGILAVVLGRWAERKRLLALPPGAFRPVPKVHSTVVNLRFHAPDQPAQDETLFRAMAQAVFTRRRKTLANALLAFGLSDRIRPGEALAEAGIDGRRRAETLETGEFVRLADAFARRVNAHRPGL
jgi:16S rRNA (adenine1518-N6/adenine1519-N6)-dimethyltransferase